MVATGDELVSIYADSDELIRHARVIDLDEVEENEFNLNIPRYVDTFEPKPRLEVSVALDHLAAAEMASHRADLELKRLLQAAGYAN